jgi:hypothetical protein
LAVKADFKKMRPWRIFVFYYHFLRLHVVIHYFFRCILDMLTKGIKGHTVIKHELNI